MTYQKNTKIVCTLGPASDSVSEISKLVQAGMNIARLNFSHGTHEHHAQLIKNIREVEKKTGKRIGILQDLQGPKIRLGKIAEEGIKIKKGETFILTAKKAIGFKTAKETVIPVQYQSLIDHLKKDSVVLLSDGLIQAKVISKIAKNVKCIMQCGGTLKSHMGISFPNSSLSLPAITAKDKKDLSFGLKHNVDFVALSFVKSQKDIESLRSLIKKYGKDTKIVAKIERHEAITNLEEIVKTADALMIARGDLGIDIPPEQVPVAQKRIIHLANTYGKPVITATEVLLSMVTNPRATRAEVSDAANAVFDRTDAIMLSNESAVGKYPAKAAATLSRVAQTVEEDIRQDQELAYSILKKFRENDSANSNCLNACELSLTMNADYLVVYTSDGFTAREVSKYRIFIPIITITESEKASRELTLSWGLNKIFTHKISGTDKTKEILSFLKKIKQLKKGQKIVIVCNASQKEKLISQINL